MHSFALSLNNSSFRSFWQIFVYHLIALFGEAVLTTLNPVNALLYCNNLDLEQHISEHGFVGYVYAAEKYLSRH